MDKNSLLKRANQIQSNLHGKNKISEFLHISQDNQRKYYNYKGYT